MKKNPKGVEAERFFTWEEVSWITGIAVEQLMAMHKQDVRKVTIFKMPGHKRSVSQTAFKAPATALAGRP